MDKGDWHLHTNHVEGENTILEMCEQAEKNGLHSVAFTEHVRKNIDYDFNDIVNDVEEARERFPSMKILIGCEAKILLGGDIDVNDSVLKLCDIVIASFHGFPPEKAEQMSALKTALKNPDVDIWGHPATIFRNFEVSNEEMENVIRLCIDNKVLIENSLCPKYPTPPDFLELVKKLGAETITSSDAHSIYEIRKID